MNDLNQYRSQIAYKRLEDGPIDDIDAAVFTGDMFMLEENRIQFREMMDRWESKLIQLEQIQRETEWHWNDATTVDELVYIIVLIPSIVVEWDYQHGKKPNKI